MKKWFAHAPGMVYAVTVYGNNEQEARAALRAFLGRSRLPAGSSVWTDTEDYKRPAERSTADPWPHGYVTDW